MPSVLVNASNAEIYDSVDAKKLSSFLVLIFILKNMKLVYAEREKEAAGAKDVYERSNAIIQKVGEFFASDYKNLQESNPAVIVWKVLLVQLRITI